MTKVSDLDQIDAVTDETLFYGYDPTDPGNPDKRVPYSMLRPAGAVVTDYLRFDDDVTIPNLAALAETDVTLSVPGALPGDNVIFNFAAAQPANIAVCGVFISAADAVKVRFRNTHATNAFVTAAVAAVALVIRSNT